MASKRSARRGTGRSGKSGKPPRVLELSKRARDEVAELLKRSRTGTITGVDMQTGLDEVQAQLNDMCDFIFDFKHW